MLLVECIDRLLEVFREEPGYAGFLLDSQTVPLEDYLVVRPERRLEIEELVRAGKLFIGPWYTCPEEFCVSGESLVRNLLYGRKTAAAFGGAMEVGYSPFSYGQASQMPQIYLGFGIDTILFYHGIDAARTKSEFVFQGPDGSKVLASRMGSPSSRWPASISSSAPSCKRRNCQPYRMSREPSLQIRCLPQPVQPPGHPPSLPRSRGNVTKKRSAVWKQSSPRCAARPKLTSGDPKRRLKRRRHPSPPWQTQSLV